MSDSAPMKNMFSNYKELIEKRIQELNEVEKSQEIESNDLTAKQDQSLNATKDLLESIFSEEQLRQCFHRIDVANSVEEKIDDLIPDIDNTNSVQLQKALSVIAEGLEQCSTLKRTTDIYFYSRIEGELKREIRQHKDRIIDVRRKILEKIDELTKKALQANNRGNSTSAGFAGFGNHDFAKQQAESEAKRLKLIQETNEYVAKQNEEIREMQRKSAEKSNKMFNRALFPEKYRKVIIVDDDFDSF